MARVTLQSIVTGTVWDVLKQAGDTVDLEETVAIVESMKMEIPLTASHAGRIERVFVAKGEIVSENQAVAVIIVD